MTFLPPFETEVLFPKMEKDISTICQQERVECALRVQQVMRDSGLLGSDGKLWQGIMKACVDPEFKWGNDG